MSYKWHNDRAFLAILLVEQFASYTAVINRVSTPYIAREFALSQADVAAMFGWFALGLLGTMFFSRLGDGIGRRTLVLVALSILWLTTFLSIFITDYFAYVCIQIALHFSTGTLFAIRIIPINVR